MLKNVVKGFRKRPFFIGIHGHAGVGKTTFASNAPAPLFLATEQGTDQLDVDRIDIRDWHSFIETLQDIATSEHEYKTVVVDSIDHLESKIHKLVAHDHGKNSIEDIGYAKGYIFALDYWHKMLDQIIRIREKGINVILIGHSIVKKTNDPVVGDDYDRFELKLHAKARDLITESMDALLFAKNRVLTSKDSSTKKVTAMSDGKRLLFTEWNAGYEAKNRYGLPSEIPLSWAEFDKYASRTPAEKAAEIKKEINSILAESFSDDAELIKNVNKAIEKANNNIPKLEEYLTTLKGRLKDE